jgi:chitosanase
MAKVITRRVPCGQCDFWSDFFRDAGMKVLGCQPVAGSSECEISMVDPALGEVAAVASTEAHPAMSLPRGGMPAPLPPAEAAAPAQAPAAAAAPLTPTQVRTAQALVNLFETGSVRGDYGQVTVLPGDTGHLTFGRSQTTLASGNLALLIEQYTGNAGAQLGARLRAWLPRLRARDLALDDDLVLHNLLRATADDPVMRETQDAFFDATYWQPAMRRAMRHGLTLPLSVAVVYDSTVHGSWDRLRRQVDEQLGPPAQAGQTRWVQAYLDAREGWLAQHPNALLRKTTYRTVALRRLAQTGAWGLELPLVVRGSEISMASLEALPPGCFAGPQPGSRALGLQEPLLRGLDVRRAQLGLSLRGVDIRADGVFGRGSRDRVLEFQASHGLPMTGALEAALVSELARL